MNRFFVVPATLCALGLAGCEQTRPPTPEGLKLIRARTATGTVNTKLESKSQPSPPRAGQVSIWDFKVFDIRDKPDGTRTEWKFFKDLPQSSTEQNTTGVLMNAWLISRDKSVFLPQKPAFKQYGSFVTDWTIPKSGPYTLWVQYQPVVAKDELSFKDLEKAPALPLETARWDFAVEGAAATPRVDPKETVYSLDSSDYGARAPVAFSLNSTQLKGGQKTILFPRIGAASGIVTDQSVTILSPDDKILLHEVGAAPSVTLKQKGVWRAWFCFSLDGKPFAAPVDLRVS